MDWEIDYNMNTLCKNNDISTQIASPFFNKYLHIHTQP